MKISPYVMVLAASTFAFSSNYGLAETNKLETVDQQISSLKPTMPDRDLVLAQLLKRTKWTTIQSGLNIVYYVSGQDGVATKSDIEANFLNQQIRGRATKLSQLLRMDLNWDGVVTREEATTSQRSPTKLRKLSSAKPRLVSFNTADKNSDGKLTMDEMRAYAAVDSGSRSRRRNAHMTNLLAMDENDDGDVSLKEAEGVMSALFARFDKDGDWILNEAEWKTARIFRRDAKRALRKLRK